MSEPTGRPAEPSEDAAIPEGAEGGVTPRPGLDDRDRTLHPRVVLVWRVVGVTILPFVLLPPLIVATIAWGVPALVGGGIVVLAAVILAIWFPRLRYRAWSWRVTPIALELRHGVVVRRHQAIPYFRIQQIDIAQGPVDRMAELATLQVTSASSSGGGALPGISAADAPGIRAELLTRAAEAVGEHLDDLSDAV